MKNASASWSIVKRKQAGDEAPLPFAVVAISCDEKTVSTEIPLPLSAALALTSASSRHDIALALGGGFVRAMEQNLLLSSGWDLSGVRLLGPFDRVTTFAELEEEAATAAAIAAEVEQ